MSFPTRYDKPDKMFRWVPLFLLLTIVACSGGGGGGSNPIPKLPWGGFRSIPNNAAVGNAINRNKGTVRLLIPAGPGGMTVSTASIDNEGNVYVGTGDGVISVDSAGKPRWKSQNRVPIENGVISTCELDGRSVPIGPVSSSPTVTPGQTIVFGSDASSKGPGGVFALQENGDDVKCLWAYQPTGRDAGIGFRSSAQVEVDSLDFGLVSIFIGGDGGALQALNRTGTPRWTAPTTSPATGPMTSMPAFSTAGVFYVTTPDGLLLAIDTSGRLLWQFAIGNPPAAPLQHSPAVAVTAFAIGASSAVFGVNPDGRLKWQYQPMAPVLGSPAFASQSVDEGSESVSDSIVYIADVDGRLYGIRDENGMILKIQRCSDSDTDSNNDNKSCRMDSCLRDAGHPDGGQCDRDTKRCTLLPDEQCTADTCVASDQGKCLTDPDPPAPIAFPCETCEPVSVETSPIVSGDLFAVVGTTDGRVCARNLDGSLPDGTDATKERWATGCIEIGATCSDAQTQQCEADTCLRVQGTCVSGKCSESKTACSPDSCVGTNTGTCMMPNPLPVRSSPSIGLNDRIFVSTDAGLYVIE